ncbi:MAG TPA: glycoside hydrolase family 97 N-terminal domain-containing protein, partial [Gemmatimonadales bacterium]|nr:glycoside hydrolase family 97 N-terminal domain-containing protein [Gemmatimonadales bacterium]
MRCYGATLLAIVIPWSLATSQARVTSPDGRNQVVVATHDGKLFYAVLRDGRPLLTPSLLGFQFRGQPLLQDSLRIVDSSRSTFDTTWTQPWGEVARIRDHHNELKLGVAEQTAPNRKFTLAVRAFNDGVAFRYEFPAQPALQDFEITDELTEFVMADNARAWWIASNRPRLDRSEQLWSEGPVSTLDSVQTPLTMETRDGKTFVVIHEANLVD